MIAPHEAAERAARDSYGKLVAYLAARCGDFNAAEDALADAFATALERWPADGVPRVPEAWLFVTARRRLIDRARTLRRADTLQTALTRAANDAQRAFECEDELTDERLGSMFACAHPSLPAHIRGPLILQVVLGFDAARIASAFLVPPATMGQRLVRAKRKIAEARIPLRVPPAEDLSERLDAVLAAIYATFTEGWGDPAGLDDRARGLAVEAIHLGRLVANLLPHEPEALGLVALMLHAHARAAARRGADGTYVPLDAQDPKLWDHAAIDEAEALLERASRAGTLGRFQIEAAIQSAHTVRRHGRATDWAVIAGLYELLWRATGSPIVALNRAVAIGRRDGAPAGIAALDAIDDPRMDGYQPYWAARADLHAQSGDAAAARAAYERAIGMCVDPHVRRYLTERYQSHSAGMGTAQRSGPNG